MIQIWEFLKVCLCMDANRDIYWATSDCPAWSSRNPFPPWCHRAMRLLLMPTRSFCSETHQSARCLIWSERWESIAICTPAPKSSLWTCHSLRITCSVPGVASHQRVLYQHRRRQLYTRHSQSVSKTFTRPPTQRQVHPCYLCTRYHYIHG